MIKKDFKVNYKVIQSMILSAITVICFLLQDEILISSNYVHEVHADFIIENMNKKIILHDFDFTMFIFFVILWYFYYWQINKGIKYNHIYLSALSGIYSMCMMMGYGFYYAGGWDFYFSSISNVLKGGLIFGGYYFLFYTVLYWIENIIDQHNIGGSLYIKKYDFLKRWLFICIAWLPYIILKYPGGINYDAVRQVDAYLGYAMNESGHPPITTVIFGLCVAIGRKIFDENLGLFIYNFLQFLVMSAAFAFVLNYLCKQGINKLAIGFCTICVGVLPIYPIYATTMVKDNLFSVGLMLYSVMIFEIIRSNNIWMEYLGYRFTYFISIFLMCTFRFNGIYIFIPTTVVLIIYFTIRNKNYKQILQFTCLMVGFIILINIGNKDIFYKLIPKYVQNENQDKTSESAQIISNTKAISILDYNMMQQMARIVCKYPDEISDEDKEVINLMMDYDRIIEVYNPQYLDHIAWIAKGCAKEERDRFVSTWCQYFIHHPITYIEAVFHKSYGFFYPGVTNYWNYWDPQGSRITEDLQYATPIVLHRPLEKLKKIVGGVEKLPFIYILENIGFSFWIILYCTFKLLHNKKYGYLISYIPVAINFIIVIMGPNFFWSPRYGYPFVYLAPIFGGLSILVTNCKEKYQYANKQG